MKHPYFILILVQEQHNENTASKKMESAMKTWVKEKES